MKRRASGWAVVITFCEHKGHCNKSNGNGRKLHVVVVVVVVVVVCVVVAVEWLLGERGVDGEGSKNENGVL